jgi:phospholipid/cholesterol/gamma-HCH transport system substrate-binding protein
MSGPLDAIRRRLDIIPGEHRTRPVAVGLIVIGVTLFAILSAATRDIPLTGKKGETVRAEFAAANQVSDRTVVRVGGVDVGRVDKVEPGSSPLDSTRVFMQITNDDVVLHRDATATVRWRTLLGGLMYIDLDPGSKSAPELGDGVIPVSRTSNQVELDQFLQPYDGPTSQGQRNLLKGLRDTLADPQAIGRTIDTLSPAFGTVAQGLGPLRGRESDDLRGLIAATADTVEGLDDAAALRGLVSGGNRTFATTTARREELGELLELSPGSLDSTFTTMRRLRTTLDHLDPLAARLRPGARALGPAARAATPALEQTEAFLREARPLLRAARPAFNSLRGASANGVPLMEGLDPTLVRLDKELLPYLRETDPDTRLKNYHAIGPFWAALAMAAAETDAEGHRIRFTVPPGANSFVSLPVTNSATRACAASKLPTTTDMSCSRVVEALFNGWFGKPKGGKGR